MNRFARVLVGAACLGGLGVPQATSASPSPGSAAADGPFTVARGDDLWVEVPNQDAWIEGTVTDGEGPIAGACVVAAEPNSGAHGTACADTTGRYRIGGLDDGSYQVRFSAAGYLEQYFDGVAYWWEATPVSITGGQPVDGVDAVLLTEPRLEGTMVAADNGEPLDGRIEAWSTSVQGEEGYAGSADVVNGSYSLSLHSSPTGPYILRAHPDDPRYVEEYYDGSPTESGAATFSPTGGDVIGGIDFTLDLGGRITGTVSGPGGPIPDAGVTVRDVDGFWVDSVSTDQSGTYVVEGLGSGGYIVYFQRAGYVGEYFDDVSDSAEATPVAVTAPDTTGGIDAVLEQEATLSGVVTDASTGLPIEARVVLLTGDGEPVWPHYTFTSPDGVFGFSVPGGTQYVLRVAEDDYVAEYYDDATELSSATRIEPAAGETITGLDFALERSDYPPSPRPLARARRPRW